MVDQVNEWLPLITPGVAEDWVQKTSRGRGRVRKWGPENKRFSTVRPVQSVQSEEQFWQRRLPVSFFHGFLFWVHFSFLQFDQLSAIKAKYILDCFPEQTKGYCESLFQWNGAVKISHIANTHSTVLCWPCGWQPNYTEEQLRKSGGAISAGDW